MNELAEQIDALLAINATGKVSHPVPGLAVELLTKAAEALRHPVALPDELEVVAWRDRTRIERALDWQEGFAHAEGVYQDTVKDAEARAKTAEAQVKRLTEENEALRGFLYRYRNETPLGHQPHMIAAEVDQALSGSKE